MPAVSLYSGFLSPKNPHTAELDRAYRELESKFRAQSCTSCHSPANPAKMDHLNILSFPVQALTSRDEIVPALENGGMPPNDIKDPAEKAALIEAAKKFRDIANKAMSFEHAAALSPAE